MAAPSAPVVAVTYDNATLTMDTADIPVGEFTQKMDAFAQLGKVLVALHDLDEEIDAAEDPINLSQRRDVVVGQKNRLVRDLGPFITAS